MSIYAEVMRSVFIFKFSVKFNHNTTEGTGNFSIEGIDLNQFKCDEKKF